MKEYQRKRRFDKTPEPSAEGSAAARFDEVEQSLEPSWNGWAGDATRLRQTTGTVAVVKTNPIARRVGKTLQRIAAFAHVQTIIRARP